VIRDDGAPAGCGGIKLFGSQYGEIKRMYVRPGAKPLPQCARIPQTSFKCFPLAVDEIQPAI